MSKLYDYPDPKDNITLKCIENYEYNKGYWQQSEERILNKIEDLITQNFNDRCLSVLDAGCGEGRLLTRFAKLAEKVVGIEPDQDRCNNAKSFIRDHELSDKISTYCCKLEEINEIESEKFDVAISSHIIQHIPTYTLDEHLSILSESISDNGLLVVNTCHSTKDTGYFVENKINSLTSEFEETQITEVKFNELAVSVGVLPIHVFDKDYLVNKICELGFELIFQQVFHVEPVVQKTYGLDVDEIINKDEILSSRNGRDMSLVFKKKV